ncbi:MAG TPA: cell division protein ZapA [Terriglobales bacterium]|nr:cell division protein ZapA [Terriglobales bacterium]
MATMPKEQPARDPQNNSVRVEIFDQAYNLRGSDPQYIMKLAEYVDGKMRAVAEATSTVDTMRLAVLAALNIADEYHIVKRQLEAGPSDYVKRASRLSHLLDEVLENKS